MTKLQHKEYMKEVDKLIDLNPKVDTSKGRRLRHLVDKIYRYEKMLYIFKRPSIYSRIMFRVREMFSLY